MLQTATELVKYVSANLIHKVVILSLPKYLLQSRLTLEQSSSQLYNLCKVKRLKAKPMFLCGKT